MTRLLHADCHVHSSYSDGEDDLLAMVEAGIAAGLDVMVLTDHLTLPTAMDPTADVSVAARDLPFYRADVLALDHLSRAKGGPEVVLGFECDWYPGSEANIARWSAGAKVRLGSVHWVGGGWMDDAQDLSVYEELGADELWRRYVDAWCSACESPANFDVMAHPDLARRFEAEGWAPTIDLAPLYDRMAECAHDTGKRIELSTAGLRKPFADYYPARPLLERFRRAEVPITLGSDAHRACDVAFGLADARAHALEIGYREQQVPHADGSWETCTLA